MADSAAVTSDNLQLPLQPTSLDIWDAKYRLKDAQGRPLERDIAGSRRRVAKALAAAEAPAERARWRREFLWALEHGAVPAGRIWSNLGAGAHKPATSTINCVVSRQVPDSMAGIMQVLSEAALSLKAGCGIGYDFSTLRPRGAPVHGAGATTSGPLSFMDVFDAMCFTVSSAGGRRGAQMGCMDVGHPDIRDFIAAKAKVGRLRQFNLSVLVRDEFLQAVRDDADWALAFPAFEQELDDPDIPLIYRDFPGDAPGRARDDAGRVAMRVYATVPARELWDRIMRSTYERAEPGFILIDRVNELNNNWFCEQIRATNPCGEQPLPPNGACLLGSVNLTAFVREPFTAAATFDWELFRQVVGIFTRMLDNVVELHGLPLPAQVEELRDKRRHGMGFFALGSTLAMLRQTYGSAESLSFAEGVARELAVAGWRAGLELAREKGPAPVLAREFEVTAPMLAQRPEMAADGYQVGDRVPGRVLHARYSRYMQAVAKVEPALVEALAAEGSRFTHHSSVAPTGTIALSFGNNASNGIEPSYSHHYCRNVLRAGRRTREQVDVHSFELLAWRRFVDPQADVEALPDYFATAQAVAPRAHLEIQAAVQKWVDSAISKTINVPGDFPFASFKTIYLDAAAAGLKGCTTYRYNPEAYQGVLVTRDELAGQIYEFTLEDGRILRFRGGDKVEYEGQVHTAANLYDAIREGYYGRL